MSEFDTFLTEIISGSRGLAQQTLQGFVAQAQSDTSDFLERSKQQLHDFTTQLARGELSKDEFTDLVGGLKDLAAMHALTQAGIAAATVQRFRDAVINLVIETAFKTFLP